MFVLAFWHFHIPVELASWNWLVQSTHALGELWSQGAKRYIIYQFSTYNKSISGWSLDSFSSRIGPSPPSVDDLGVPPITGRLGQSLEGGEAAPLETISRRGSYSQCMTG